MSYSKEDSQYLRALGRRIRQFREEKRWSQEEFAFQCDLHRTYVGDVERGERNIAILNLRKMARSLGLKVHDLFPPDA